MASELINLAIVSPSLNAYSETFIQAHRNIKANVFFYYGGSIPTYLENFGYIGPSLSKFSRLKNYLRKKIGLLKLSTHEDTFASSLKSNGIDLVFAEYGTSGASLVNTCKYLKIPLVAIFHGYDASIYSVLNDYETKYAELFDYAKTIVAVSNPIKNKLIDIGCDCEKIVVTPCAPNDSFLAITPTFREARSFVAIGRFVDKKAPYYTILAFKKVVEKYSDAKLYMGGNGELFAVCEHLVKYFKLQNNIILLGAISPIEYANILSKVSGFIQHSIVAVNGDMEGTPVAVLEASAAGLPVITTRHGGIPDVIVDGVNGLLVEEHDVDGMAERIIQIIENPHFAMILGQRGKEIIRENFTMNKHLRTLEKALGIIDFPTN